MRWSDGLDALIGLYAPVCTFIVCIATKPDFFIFDGTSAICDDN